MSLPTLKDQTQEAEDLLLWQWRDSPNVKGLLKSFIENIQTVEVALFQSLDERGIAVAVGEQLDVLGRLIGETRKGKEDLAYRIALISRVTANNSDGSTESILNTLAAITKADKVTFFEHYPASVHMYASQGVGNGITVALDNASSAGIGVRVLYDLDQGMFLAAEFTEIADTILVDNLAQNIQVIDADSNLYDLVMGSLGASTTEPRSIFPEYFGLTSQLLDNPDYVDGLTNWTTLTGTPSVTSGALSLASGDSIGQSISTTNGADYSILLDSLSSSATFEVRVGTTSGGSEVVLFNTDFDSLGDIGQMVDFTATATTTYITVADTGSSSSVDGIYVGDKWVNTTKQNVLCDVLDSTDFALELGDIIDNLGDNLVSDIPENIKYLI